MRTGIALFLALFLMVLSGCGAADRPAEIPANTESGMQTAAQEAAAAVGDTGTEAAAYEGSVPSGKEETVPEESVPSGTEDLSGVLVLYFSRTGEQYTVGVIEKGNTAIVAEMIAERTGADLFEVIPADDHYPMTYDALTDVAKKEQNDRARPAYSSKLPDLSGYSTVFIGAPVWWGDWPMIMYTVFENNDFSGKTLIPFSTHEGSGLSGFDKKLQNACPGAEISKGLAVRGNDAQNNREKTRESVGEWLSGLGF